MKAGKWEEANVIRAIHLTDHSFVSQLIGKYSWSIQNSRPRSVMQFHKESGQGAIHVTEQSTRIEIKQYIQPLHVQLIYRSAQLVAAAQARVQALSSLLQNTQSMAKLETTAHSYRAEEEYSSSPDTGSGYVKRAQYSEQTGNSKRYIAVPQQHEIAPFSADYPLLHRLEQERVASWKLKSSQQLLHKLSERELAFDLTDGLHKQQTINRTGKSLDNKASKGDARKVHQSIVKEGDREAIAGDTIQIPHTITIKWSERVSRLLLESSLKATSSQANEESNAALHQPVAAISASIPRRKAILQPRSIINEKLHSTNIIEQHQLLHTAVNSKQLLRKLQLTLLQGKQQIVIKQRHNQPLLLSYRVLQDNNSLHERKVSRVHRGEAGDSTASRSLLREKQEQRSARSEQARQDQRSEARSNQTNQDQRSGARSEQARQDQRSEARSNQRNQDQRSEARSEQARQDQRSEARSEQARQDQRSEARSEQARQDQRSGARSNQANQDQPAAPQHNIGADMSTVDSIVVQPQYKVGQQAPSDVSALHWDHTQHEQLLAAKSQKLPSPIRTTVQKIAKLRLWHRALNEQGERVVSLWSKLEEQTATPTMNIRLVHRKLSEQERQQAAQRFSRQSAEQPEHRRQASLATGSQVKYITGEQLERSIASSASNHAKVAKTEVRSAMFRLQKDERFSYYLVSKRVLVKRVLQQYYAAKQRQDSLVYNAQPATVKLAGVNQSITILDIAPTRMIGMSKEIALINQPNIQADHGHRVDKQDAVIVNSIIKQAKPLLLKQRLELISDTIIASYSSRTIAPANQATRENFRLQRKELASAATDKSTGVLAGRNLIKLYYRPTSIANTASLLSTADTASAASVASVTASEGINSGLVAADERLTRRQMLRTRLIRTLMKETRLLLSPAPSIRAAAELKQSLKPDIEAKVQEAVQTKLHKRANLHNLQLTSSITRFAQIVAQKQLVIDHMQRPSIMRQQLNADRQSMSQRLGRPQPSSADGQTLTQQPVVQATVKPMHLSIASISSSGSDGKTLSFAPPATSGQPMHYKLLGAEAGMLGSVLRTRNINTSDNMLTSRKSEGIQVSERNYPAARLDVKKEAPAQVETQGVKQLQQSVQRLEQQLQQQQVKWGKQDTQSSTRQLVDQLYEELSRKLRMEAKRFGR